MVDPFYSTPTTDFSPTQLRLLRSMGHPIKYTLINCTDRRLYKFILFVLGTQDKSDHDYDSLVL